MSDINPSADVKLPRGARRKLETRRRLVEAARSVMARDGIAGAAIADIAEEADVGFGSFYNHFKTKDDIAQAALVAEVEKIGFQPPAPDAEPAAALTAFLARLLEHARSDPTGAAFLCEVFPTSPPADNPVYRHLVRLVEDVGSDLPDLTAEFALAMLTVTLQRLSTDDKAICPSFLYRSLLMIGVEKESVAGLIRPHAGDASAKRKKASGRLSG